MCANSRGILTDYASNFIFLMKSTLRSLFQIFDVNVSDVDLLFKLALFHLFISLLYYPAVGVPFALLVLVFLSCSQLFMGRKASWLQLLTPELSVYHILYCSFLQQVWPVPIREIHFNFQCRVLKCKLSNYLLNSPILMQDVATLR